MTTLPTTVRERIDLPSPSAGRAQAARPDTSVTFQDILAILKRRFVLITFLFLLFSTLAVGGWLVCYLYFPLWEAEGFVECISDQPKGMSVVDQAPGQKEYDRFIMTQAHFVKSADILMAALQSPEVRGTSWYRKMPESERTLEFMELVEAAPQRGTNLLRISVATRSKDDPDIIVNTVMNKYLDRVKDYNVEDVRAERDGYKEEHEAVLEQIADKQKQLASVQRQLPAGITSSGTNTAAADYLERRQLVTQYEVITQELEALDEIYNMPGGPALSPEDQQMVELDPQVATLSNQLFSLRQQLAVNKKKYGENHRTIKTLNEYIDVVTDQLETTRQRKLAETLALKRDMVHTAYLNAQHALLTAKEKLADSLAHLADMDEVMAEYMTIEEDILLLKQNRETLAQYIRELDRIIKERTAIRVERQQDAIEPLQRSFPQKFLLPAGVAVALVLAVGIAIMLEFVSTSLVTPQCIVKHLRIPLLGAVPDADDEEVDIEQIETAVRDAPQSMFAEIFRTIRTNLQFTATADRQRTVLITSPKPEDGKTVIACNLAAMIAQGGKRVLLVDANFRRPALHRIFAGNEELGLSNYLVGDGDLKRAIYRTDIANLDVLAAGPLPPNPAELMSGQRMGDFLAEVSQSYDQVFIDSPPVLLASDACVLASRVDGVILVVRAKVNSRGIGSRACGLVSAVNGHMFGAILNAAQVQRGGYFREQLRSFYDYRLDDDEVGYTRTAALPHDGGPTDDADDEDQA